MNRGRRERGPETAALQHTLLQTFRQEMQQWLDGLDAAEANRIIANVLTDNHLPVESLREAARINQVTEAHFELVDRLLLWATFKSPAARLFRLMAGKLISRMINQRHN